MSELRFSRIDLGSGIAVAPCADGRLMLTPSRRDGVSELRYALRHPDGMTGHDVDTAYWKAAPNSPERTRLGYTLPFAGARLGWFATTEDGEAILSALAAQPSIADVEAQISDAGFKPYLSLPSGTKVYARHVTASASSNAFHLALSPTGVELTFERASTSDPLFTVWLGGDKADAPMPEVLANLEACVACAIAMADRYLASGRTRRRTRAA